MIEEMSKEQKFLMLIQTAAIIKQLSGEANEIKKTRTANMEAHDVLGGAMRIFKYVPEDIEISEAADDFIDYIYSKEELPRKPDWMLDSGR